MRIKATAIVEETLVAHYTKKVVTSIAYILMDESNDARNKSCTILVKILDEDVGDVMLVVTIGTASNLFIAVRKSLRDNGLDLKNAIALCRTPQI